MGLLPLFKGGGSSGTPPPPPPSQPAWTNFVKVEVDFTSNWNSPTSYTDVTSALRLEAGLTWERGRNDEFTTSSPGSASFTLNNRNATYDPTTNTNMVPARPMKITCYDLSFHAYQQFDGMVEEWTPVWSRGGEAVVTADAVERYAALQFCRIGHNVYIATTDVRVRLGQLADGAGWPVSLRSFHAGSFKLPTETVDGTDTLAQMKVTAAGQVQDVYASRTGVLTTRGLFGGTTPVTATFGDGAGELKFADVTGSVGGAYIYTQVQVTAAGPPWIQGQPNTVTVNFGSPWTKTKYGTRTYAQNIAATDPTSAGGAATGLAMVMSSQNGFRVKTLTINPMADMTNLLPVVLAADLGDMFTIKWTVPGSGTRREDTVAIRSIRHEINEGGWVVVWTLSPAPGGGGPAGG